MPSFKGKLEDLKFFGIDLETIKQQPVIIVTSSPLKKSIIGTHLEIYGIKFDNEKNGYCLFKSGGFANHGKTLRFITDSLASNNNLAEQFGTNYIFISAGKNWNIQLRNYGIDDKCIQNVIVTEQHNSSFLEIKQCQKTMSELAKKFKDYNEIGLLHELNINHLDESLIHGILGFDATISQQPLKLKDLQQVDTSQLWEIIAMRYLIGEISDQYDNVKNDCINFLINDLQKKFKGNDKRLVNEQQALVDNPKQTIIQIQTQTEFIPIKDLYKNLMLAKFNMGCERVDEKYIALIPVTNEEFDKIFAQALEERKNLSTKPYSMFGDSKLGHLFFKPGANCINYVIKLLNNVIKPPKNSKDWYYSGEKTFQKLGRVEIFKTMINAYVKDGTIKTEKFNDLLKATELYFKRFCSITEKDVKFNPKLHLTLEECNECYEYAKRHLLFSKKPLNDEQKKKFQTEKSRLHDTFYEKLEIFNKNYKNSMETLPSLAKLLMI